ncbi:dTDP-4-dehydrorhamnose reductase [Burkholderia vietnamiensis]|uniref:dTDP-4-dehydrorhamnose reductase n=1 Tax=Burkholderia vietnamiensis TaxID=60552 RepID=UPI00075C0FA4|nr:dTDP-4-dehydrorhamnose reductase [Burkholderia vietnamiensis]KVS04842.1 dTDP-4-dehydrorhamnose reductase [Burkholderia vietnamiensis]KVS21074.1 dTDP-4-dehydrorhamnose reductase [Burkholderia vietnamiensis]MBR8013150.1 dTDP-4-dehydrorhamnose reductase [Burkholderia vietnamiensis]MCA7983604.1 dTDP-4-dehydrorhamnose reductase [Burkholderia vietnamiensis]MDN8071307.1 dTDP-4-dehydrorhamnose reductase [Burkholderia vietnamiensis]
MNILITGASGQVGWALARALAPLGRVTAADRRVADLSNPASLRDLVLKLRPTVVVNAAAYTAVDKAEEEESLATLINGEAPGVLAAATREVDGLFVHYSTDYVFDGSTGHYCEGAQTNPLNAYGRSKLAGEKAVAEAGGNWLTFRTAWVYADRAENFFLTMLRLATRHEQLSVVADQTGTPTSARLIASLTAHAIVQALGQMRAGSFTSDLYHMTASGSSNRHGFVESIVDVARRVFPEKTIKTNRVLPVSSDQFPTAAARPKNSVLDNQKFDARFGLNRPDWRDDLHYTIADLAEAANLYRVALRTLLD